MNNITLLQVYNVIAAAVAVSGVIGSALLLVKKGLSEVSKPLNSINTKVDQLQTSVTALSNGTKASLCESLIRRGKEYKKAHFVSEEDYKRFVEDYQSYKAIGGNGYVDDLKESIEKLYDKGVNYDK